MPEMVQEIFGRAADAPMIIGRAEENHIGAIYPCLQFCVARQIMRDVGIVERERFLLEIQQIDSATERLKFIADISDDGSAHRVPMQASDDGEHIQRRFWHLAKVPKRSNESTRSNRMRPCE